MSSFAATRSRDQGAADYCIWARTSPRRRDGETTSGARDWIAVISDPPLLCQVRFAICGFLPGAGHQSWSGDCDPLFRWCRQGLGDGLGVVEQVPDLSGDVAFQGSDRFAFGFAF